MTDYWHILRSKRGDERHQAHRLVEAGFDALVPVLRKCRGRRGQVIEAEIPAIPGYVFASPKNTDAQTVRQYVMGDDGLSIVNGLYGPLVVPNSELQIFAAECAKTFEPETVQRVRVGDLIHVWPGMFDFTAPVVSISGQRAHVILNGFRISVDVGAATL